MLILGMWAGWTVFMHSSGMIRVEMHPRLAALSILATVCTFPAEFLGRFLFPILDRTDSLPGLGILWFCQVLPIFILFFLSGWVFRMVRTKCANRLPVN